MREVTNDAVKISALRGKIWHASGSTAPRLDQLSLVPHRGARSAGARHRWWVCTAKAWLLPAPNDLTDDWLVLDT